MTMTATTPGVTAPSPEIKNAEHLGMVIDLNRCIGCWTCAVACKQENNVPEGLFYLRILTLGDGDAIDVPSGTFPDVSLAYEATNCYHCEHPPCVKACPTQATFKQDNGIVAIDYDRCIGCRYCMVACPYDNRTFNWRAPVQDPPPDVAPVGVVAPRQKGVVEKCTFCTHRVDEGLEPRCIIACPTGARFFGDLADPGSEVSQLVRDNPTYTVFPEKGTEPSVHYIPRRAPNVIDAGGVE